MIQLTADLFKNGGLVAFAGGQDVFKAGAGALLSKIIGDVEKDPNEDSHVGLVMPQAYWGMSPVTNARIMGNPGPMFLESTIENGVSGPQYNLVIPTVRRYIKEGGHARFFEFLPEFTPNWPNVWQYGCQTIALQKAGKLHYGVIHLVADLVARQTWLESLVAKVAGLPPIDQTAWVMLQGHGLVCSEYESLLEKAGGVDVELMATGIPWLPDSKPVMGQPIGCTPLDCTNSPVRKSPIQLC